jgi:hypothetical protein
MIASANFNDIKRFQEELIAQQKRGGEETSKITKFKERGERDLEQPIKNPETRVGDEDFIEPSTPNMTED